MQTWDAVVVGAGHNGLVAANLLADAGWSVLVLEAAEQPGGAVRSAELVAPGFVTDLFSAIHPMGIASPVFRRLQLDRWGLHWEHAPTELAHVFPDGRTAAISRDLAATQASLAKFAPADGPAWARVCADWQRVRDPLLDALLSPFPPVRAGLRLGRTAGVGGALRVGRLAASSAWHMAEQDFAGDGARALLLGNALHADVSPHGAVSGVLGWLLAMLAQDVGFPAPRGGAGSVVDALVARANAQGVEIHYARPVAKVLLRDGRAYGVRDDAGRTYGARHAVLADVDAPRLFGDLVGHEHLPEAFNDDLRRFTWDDALVKVNWALDAPIPWTAEEPRGAGTVHLGVDVEGFAEFAHALAVHRMPERPFVLLGQMTTIDKSRSPAGTESVWAYTHIPATLAGDVAAVDEQVKRMESAVEEQAPGFLARVRGRVVQRPYDIEGADGNLRLGSTNAGTAALHQQLVFRPVPGLGRAETPIDRLYLAGASAHPGGAVHGAPGANAARAALARQRLVTRLPAWGAQRVTARIAQGWRQR